MRILTPQILNNYPFAQHADLKTIQKGKTIFLNDEVLDLDLENGHHATCIVEDRDEEFTVNIQIHQASGELQFDCDCQDAIHHFCKHIIAAALETSRYLSETSLDFDEDETPIFGKDGTHSQPPAKNNWQNKLDMVLTYAGSPAANFWILTVIKTKNKKKALK